MLQRLLFGIGLLGCCLAQPVWAQFEQAKRIEIVPDENQDETFDVTPLQERGALLTVRRSGYYAASSMQFRFIRYTTDLKEQWAVDYKPDYKYNAVTSFHNAEYMYWLFHESDSERYLFFRINLEDGITETFEGELLYGLTVQQFKVLNGQAYIGGYHRERPVILSFSFFDKTMKVLPGLYSNHQEISSLEIDEARREVHVLVHTMRKKCQFSLRSYNYESKPLRTVEFDGAERSLISGKLVRINEQEQVLIGNYSTDCTPYSQGVYVTRVHGADNGPANPDNIQFIEFSQLKNFFNYLKPRRQEKLIAKILKRKETGKDFKFRYRLLVHDPMLTSDGLVLLAEVYYPQYRGTALPYTGNVTRSADRYYEGYRYTHAFVCGFDRQGNLLWDNCLPIEDLESSELTEKVQVSQRDDKLVLAYPNKDKIHTEVIQGANTLKERENFSLKDMYKKGELLQSDHENIMAWYGQYFLACGMQKFSSSHDGTGKEVYYINKMTYQLSDLKKVTETSTRNPSARRYE